MTEHRTHRLFLHFQELPYSLRVLYSAALLMLAIGYSFAMVYIYGSYANRDGDPMMTADDLRIAYSGNPASTRLEGALKGTMSGMLPAEERDGVVHWIRGGQDPATYETTVGPILKKRCGACHDGSNPHLPNLMTLEDVSKAAEVDTGADLFTLVRVTHIHVFGMVFIFFIVGMIFSHAYVRPVWFKCVVVGLPFLGLFTDITSWYVTKFFPPFAFVVMIGGAVMGACFAFMWLTSMYQMWFYRMPQHLADRHLNPSPERVIG